MKAKTYKSTNNWTSPQSLSTFGIPVTMKNKILYLGLEEFNFCDPLKEFEFEGSKVAYIPAFSSSQINPIKKLDLFYHNGNGVTLHYATMHEIVQIENSEVPNLRKLLVGEGFPAYVANSIDFQATYDALFPQALKIWNKNFNQNNILAPGTDSRFVLNVKYTSIELKERHIEMNWCNLKRARILYR